MKQEPLSFLQLVFLIMMSSGFYNHVLIAPFINESGRAAWIVSLLSFIPMVLVIVLVYVINKMTHHQPLIPFIRTRIGKVPSIILFSPMLFYLLIHSYMTFIDTITWTQVTYLPYTPTLILGATFLLVIVLIVKNGLTSLTITAGTLLPLVVLLGIFVSAANIPNKDYSLLFPPLANGWEPINKHLIYGISCATDLIILVFLQGKLNKHAPLWKYLMLALLLTNLLFAPVAGGIALFGPDVNAQLRYPPYEQWRVVTIGSYISHVDYFTIYQWLAGAIVRISFMLVIFLEIIQIQAVKRANMIKAIFLVCLFLTLYIPLTDVDFFELNRTIFIPLTTIVMGIYLPILIACVYWIRRR